MHAAIGAGTDTHAYTHTYLDTDTGHTQRPHTGPTHAEMDHGAGNTLVTVNEFTSLLLETFSLRPDNVEHLFLYHVYPLQRVKDGFHQLHNKGLQRLLKNLCDVEN